MALAHSKLTAQGQISVPAKVRCVVTGAHIATQTRAPASVAGGLMDLDYGAWQGRTHDEIRAEATPARPS